MKSRINRRQFLRTMGVGTATALLANAGLPAAFAGAEKLRRPTEALLQAAANPRVELLIGDVIAFTLESDQWSGPFGSVTLQLHEAFYNGAPAYYIRTDASDPEYAADQRLVFVPLLNGALSAPLAMGQFYTFANPADDQYPVISAIPNTGTFSSAWHVHRVTFNGNPQLLTSEDDIRAAQGAGDILVEALEMVVNFPVVKWPGGELPADVQKAEYLGTGPLLEPVDTGNMHVTFKLHECFPGSRYFFTDTSSIPMAPGMNIAASPPTQYLQDASATDEIWVFGNGIPGSGVMGFQPAVFDNEPGSPAWSPFWQHFTAVWSNESNARVVRSSMELRELVDAGELEIFNGVPAMDQTLPPFVVNCPVPIRARNTFDAETFVSRPAAPSRAAQPPATAAGADATPTPLHVNP